MKSNIKNILIGVAVLLALVAAYFLFIKKAPTQDALTSTSGITTGGDSTGNAVASSEIGKDFVTFLLSVKSIKLDDAIFSDPAFLSLKDSSILILLIDSGAMGRPNPFAPIGSDVYPTTSNNNNSLNVNSSTPNQTDENGNNPKTGA